MDVVDMQQLSYEHLKNSGYMGYLVPREAPERVLQFGEGNFLRAFADRYFNQANEAGVWSGRVVLAQPRDAAKTGYAARNQLNEQDCLYTVLVRGKGEDGKTVDTSEIVSCCSRCLNPSDSQDLASVMELAVSDDLEFIVSNTTEAGIVYDSSCTADEPWPASFPAKLAQVLHARWKAQKSGPAILSCELIDHNGEELLRIVKRHCADWGWETEFVDWLEQECTFCTTLVDSIVPGRIRDANEAAAVAERLGYEDRFLAVREPFQMWGIEGNESLAEKLPFIKAGLPGAFVTLDVTPYKRRKVRILNGAHTGFVPGAWLAGFDIVRDCMHDEVIRGFMEHMLESEVIPTLSDELDHEDLEKFSKAVANRFDNPFIDHQLLSICLNSCAKWRARNLPSLVDYVAKNHEVPACLATSLATLIGFYTTGLTSKGEDGLHLVRPDGTAYVAKDDENILSFFEKHATDSDADLVDAVMGEDGMWGHDLHKIAGLRDFVVERLGIVRKEGARAAFQACLL